jgi:hypothetical protein
MGFVSSKQARDARAKLELAPGRCVAIDTDGKRCRFTWLSALPGKLFCARCKARLEKQRHRARFT